MTATTCLICPRELKEGDRVLYVEPHVMVVRMSSYASGSDDRDETLGSEYRQDIPQPGTDWLCWACVERLGLVKGG